MLVFAQERSAPVAVSWAAVALAQWHHTPQGVMQS
jgi:hypothetical protein